MWKSMLAALLLCAGMTLAVTVTPPPATEPSGSTTQPTTGIGFGSLSPADLIRKMKERRLKESKLTKVAFFDLSHPVMEKPADFSLFGDDESGTLRSTIDRIRQAAKDPSIRAVLMTLGEHGLGLAQAQEVREALGEVRHAGKRSFVYADSYDTVGYSLACAATDVCLMEGGEIMIPGVGMEATFMKGFFDKVGVRADYVQIGEYKGADEEYTRTGASDELTGEMNKLADSLYGQIVDGISLNRNLAREAVTQLIDDTIVSGPAARDRGFVDHLCDQDGLRPLLKKELGNDIELVADYGRTPREAPDLTSPLGIFQLFKARPAASENDAAIALIYAQGVIEDGEGSDSLFNDSGVASDVIRKALRSALRDDSVKAVVIRIDSPGGSALASEVMWQAARRVAAKKPVIISIGGMAASGGYYLASAGDHIFADPAAIVGSIGVVGGKFVYQDLYEKLGVKTQEFKKGTNAGLFTSNEPFTDRQRHMVTNWMKQTYDQFTQRVMTTRTGKINDIDKVARGRIFVARQAVELGMVDELGGLDDALAYAAKGAKLEPGKYDVRQMPAPHTLADLLGLGGGGNSVEPETRRALTPRIELGSDSLLRAVPAPLRRSLTQQLQTLQLLQTHPVILACPFVVTVR